MLLVHSQLTMGFDQLFLHKEREILSERDREIVWTRNGFFVSRVVSLCWKRRSLTQLRSALASICNMWFALLRF